MIHVREIQESDKSAVSQILVSRWGSTAVVSRGVLHPAHELPGFIAAEDTVPLGLLTYRMNEDTCEIITLDSLEEGRGIGSALINSVEVVAGTNKCTRIWLITTNDNLHALRFYQRRGYVLTALYCRALEQSRRLKPQIPLIGNEGIPLRDEIELEKIL
jgi:GNAT superfamily N-acetyltransferase